MKKQVIAVVLILTLGMTTMCIPASAEEKTASILRVNEYDYVTALENASQEDLSKAGLTQNDVVLVLTEFKNSIATRAKMTDKELWNLGYNVLQADIMYTL